MTRMKYFYPEFLEPHSGWGRSAGRAPRSVRSTAGRDGVSPGGTSAGTMSTAPAPGHLARRAHRGRRRDRVGREMKFRVAREVLADTVAWTARSLPPRPSVPVLAGILLEVDGNQLSVSGFDYEVSARAEVDVQATEAGRALVPGRLLAEITRALPPHPVDITAEDRKSVV